MAYTYPKVWLNGVACEASSELWCLHPDHPPRSVAMPSLRTISTPNTDGALWTPQGVHGAPLFTVVLRIIGQGADVDARNASAEAAVDQWSAIVSQPRVSIRHQMYASGAGANRYATGRISSFEPENEWKGERSVIKLTMIFEIPGVFWTDAQPGTWNINQSYPAVSLGSTYTIDTDGNGPVLAGQVKVTGPISNPTITDLGSGDWIQYAGSVGAGQAVRFDLDTLRAYSGSTAAVTFSATGLTVASQFVNIGGSGQYVPSSFRLLPRWVASGEAPSNAGVGIRLTGSGSTSATELDIRGQRGYR